MYEHGLGSLGAGGTGASNESLSVASGKQYMFTFPFPAEYMTMNDVNTQIQKLSDVADSISAMQVGSDIVVSLVPKIIVTVGAWKQLFSEIGLTDMSDLDVGAYIAPIDEGFHPIDNISNYYGPTISKAWQGIKNIAPNPADIFSYIKILAIAGAVIVGGVVIMRYIPKSESK